MKPFIPYNSTKDAFDIARNDFVQEKTDVERKNNVLWYLIVFNDTLKIDVLDKERTTDIQMVVIISSLYHDRFNPRPLPEMTRTMKDGVTGQDLIDSAGNPRTERVVVILKEGVCRVYWRVAIDVKRGYQGSNQDAEDQDGG